jgi:hypothetical protein
MIHARSSRITRSISSAGVYCRYRWNFRSIDMSLARIRHIHCSARTRANRCASVSPYVHAPQIRWLIPPYERCSHVTARDDTTVDDRQCHIRHLPLYIGQACSHLIDYRSTLFQPTYLLPGPCHPNEDRMPRISFYSSQIDMHNHLMPTMYALHRPKTAADAKTL